MKKGYWNRRLEQITVAELPTHFTTKIKGFTTQKQERSLIYMFWPLVNGLTVTES